MRPLIKKTSCFEYEAVLGGGHIMYGQDLIIARSGCVQAARKVQQSMAHLIFESSVSKNCQVGNL